MQSRQQQPNTVLNDQLYHEKQLKHNDQQPDNSNQGLQDLDEEQEVQIQESQSAKTTIKCITDPFQYLEYCQTNKKIKIMDEQNVIFPNVYLKDISLHYKGPMQDKAYSKNYSYYMNVRRGNTLCQIYPPSQHTNIQNNDSHNQDNNSKFELFFCRRGMKKFYDLEKQYLATGHEQKLTSQHLKYRRRIFEKIDSANYESSKIHLYSIFKENGQHCQVTYVKRLSTWLFASKNVSILVRDELDLDKHYDKLRFYWAKLIAKEFLSLIKQMPPAQLQALKDQLDTKTLLGEHCGYEQHQHITKYDKVQIIFYAIVQKNGQDHCLPVDYCQEFLSKFNFNMSKTKHVRNLTDKNSVYQNIYSLLKETAEGSMDQYGEGSVLYVVQERSNKTQRTIAMCKLKSSEYLIFRRLREMLKLNVERKSTANTFEKFKFDIENLLQHYFKPPQNLQFYLNVGKQAFKQASKNSNVTENYLRYKFVEFIQKVQQNSKLQEDELKHKEKIQKKIIVICLPRFTNKLQKYAKSNNLPFEYMYRNIPTNPKKVELVSGALHILHMIPRLPEDPKSLQNLEIFLYEYSTKNIDTIEEQLRVCKDLTKSHLITFIKSQDKKKSLELLNDKIKSFEETLKSKKIHYSVIAQDVEDKDEQVISRLQKLRELTHKKLNEGLNCQLKDQEKQNNFNASKKIFVLFPLLLPGCGKSTLRQKMNKYCEINKMYFNFVESDQIRKKLMQSNLQEKGIELNLQMQQFSDTFSEVKEQANEEFMKSVLSVIEKHMNCPLKDQILFADKVFGPESIISYVESVSKYKNVIPVLLVPDSNELKVRCGNFPFSLQHLLICLKRCLQRQEHSTMTRRPQDIGSAFLWFLKLYVNTSFKKLQMIMQKISPNVQMIRVSTLKERDVPIHTSMRKKLEQAMDSNRNKNKIIELIEEMYKNTEDYLKDFEIEDDNDETVDKLMTQIKQISSRN